ncbi:MAG: hypothetical protein JXR22_14060, partial [Prolixibacteraceae bacterium]|nr:hypothetical protein [Prolixibacteraceae bacterium]
MDFLKIINTFAFTFTYISGKVAKGYPHFGNIFQKNHKMLIIRIVFTLIFGLFWGLNFAQNRNDSLIEVATGYNNAGMLQLREGNYRAADSLFHLSITAWDNVSIYNVYS